MSDAKSGRTSHLQRELARFRERWMHELHRDDGEPEQGQLGDAQAETVAETAGTPDIAAQDSEDALSQLEPLSSAYRQQGLGASEAASKAPSALRSEAGVEQQQEVKPLLVLPARAKEATTTGSARQQEEHPTSAAHTDEWESLFSDALERDTRAAKRPKASFSKRADIFSKAWKSPFQLKREQRRREREMKQLQSQHEQHQQQEHPERVRHGLMDSTASPRRSTFSTQEAVTRAGSGQAAAGAIIPLATTRATAATTRATTTATAAPTSSIATPPVRGHGAASMSIPASAQTREKRQPRPQNEFVKMLIDDINEDITEPLFDELLPLEVAEIVFRYLDLETLGRCALVSRTWRDLADSNRVWYAYAVAQGITTDRFISQDNWKAFVRRYILDKREKRRRWMELQTAFICLKDTASTTDVTAVSYTPRGVAAGYSDGQVRFFARENLMRSRMVDPCGRDAGAVACISHTSTAMACGTVCGRLIGWDHGFGKSFALRHSNMLHRVAICERSSCPRVLAASGKLLLAAQRDPGAVEAGASHNGGRERQPQTRREHASGREDRGDASASNGWRFQERRYDCEAFIADVLELPLAQDVAAVLSARRVDIVNTSSMTTMHNVHRSASGPSAQKCSSLQCTGAHLGFLTSEPGHWSAHLVDVASGTVVQTHSQFRHSLSALQLVTDPSAAAPTGGGGAGGGLSAPALEMAMAGSCGVLFYDARTRGVSQHIRTSGYLCRDLRVDDWRVVVSGRFTGPTGRQPPFSVALYDRRMGKQLWFVRQSVPVRFLEMDANTIVFGSHRHRDARFTTPLGPSLGHHRPRRPQLRDLDAMSCLNVLDFAAPLSSLTDEECPFSSKYEDLHGYSYNIALETPFDDVQPYKLG